MRSEIRWRLLHTRCFCPILAVGRYGSPSLHMKFAQINPECVKQNPHIFQPGHLISQLQQVKNTKMMSKYHNKRNWLIICTYQTKNPTSHEKQRWNEMQPAMNPKPPKTPLKRHRWPRVKQALETPGKGKKEHRNQTSGREIT